MSKEAQYLLHLNIHGRFRGRNVQLGADPDTGGQTSYVVDEISALGRLPEIDKVEAITRKLVDARVGPSYAEPREMLSDRVSIVRLDDGMHRYLPKEQLWDHLDHFAKVVIEYAKAQSRRPDAVHAHYADAGYVGIRVAEALGVPLLFTGHSLGRSKLARLLDEGLSYEEIDAAYNITRRIQAEEDTLQAAARVICSTEDEVSNQWSSYENSSKANFTVISPGVDHSYFAHRVDQQLKEARESVAVFLRNPELPMILCIARPDPRKNIVSLIEAFAQTAGLREQANLVLVIGLRERIGRRDAPADRVWRDMLLAIDNHNLYGSVAYPKQHGPDGSRAFFQLAADSHGIFVNAAHYEPFGLTTLEAGCCGLPVVGPMSGGSSQIVREIDMGVVVDTTQTPELGAAMHHALSDSERLQRWSRNASQKIPEKHSWDSHARRLQQVVSELL